METMKALVDKYLAPVVVGRPLDTIPRLVEDFDQFVAFGRFAKAGLEIAMFDAYARSLGVPVHALLGGKARDSIDCVQSPHEALEVVRREAAGVVAIKTTKLGGLRSRETVAVARAAGIACHAATSLEGPIATAASLHLACADPGFTYGSELFGPLLLKHELLAEPIVYDDGRVHLPEGPGLGVELDTDTIAAFARAD